MNPDIMDLFVALESNRPEQVEDVKLKFYEQFNSIREPWLLHGIYDYYMESQSQRAVELLVAVREPHDKYFFKKLGEDLQTSKRLQALTLLGHVVKRQPTWLIKITQHCLLKDLIKILISENEIIIIITAVLVIHILLTAIPVFIAPFLPDIFEGFSRLAAWNTSQKHDVQEILVFHLQVSIYVLFVQLYSMYPCSFVPFLKQKYSKNENLLVFTHTIKPMIETMRMHPNLIISNRDIEISAQRWKKMEQHDVVMECTKYTLLENWGKNDQNPSNSGLNFSSALEVLKSSIGANEDIISVNSVRNNELWSPMLKFGGFGVFHKDTGISVPTTPNLPICYKPLAFNRSEHSPPEAAVEATPETTPVRDVINQQTKLPSLNSSVARALNTFGLETLSRRNSSSPNSQPSSPLKKEGFVFSPQEEQQSQALSRRMDRMFIDRYQCNESDKDEINKCAESKSIASQVQLTINPEIPQAEEEDLIECDQQSNGSPCLTYEGGLHMPDSTSLKEFFSRRRYNSQCTPESTTYSNGQSTGNSPKRETDFPLLDRKAKSCPEIKKTSISIFSGTSPLQEVIKEKNNDDGLSNGHTSDIFKKKARIDDHFINVQNSSTQTEHIFPYEHLFYSVFPAYNDTHNNIPNKQEDESLTVVENYVRTSAIVLKHRHTSASTNDINLLKNQVTLLTLQLQFERNRREVHAERNRRLLGKSRTSRALDENNSALRDQVSMLKEELGKVTADLDNVRQITSKQIKDLKDSVKNWQEKCVKYQMDAKHVENSYSILEQLSEDERLKTAEVTKQLAETRAELFDTVSELHIAKAAADTSKELADTVSNLQQELVMCGEMQSRQFDLMIRVNTLQCDATYAMLSQESYKHYLNELQEALQKKSSMLDASNAHIAHLEQRLMEKDSSILRDKVEMENVVEQFKKEISEVKEKYRNLKETENEENIKEKETKKKFLERFPQLSSDAFWVDSKISIGDQIAEFKLGMTMPNIGESSVPASTTTPK